MEADEFEGHIARSKRRRTIVLVVVIGALITVPTGMLWWSHHQEVARHDADEARAKAAIARDEAERTRPLTAEETTELDTIADAMGRGLTKMRTAWSTIDRATLGSLAPTDHPCSVKIAAPDPAAAERYVQKGAGDASPEVGAFDLAIVEPAAAILEPPSLVATETSYRRIDVKQRKRADLEAIRAIGLPKPYLIVLVEQRAAPTVVGNFYEPGRISGRAYLYSHAQGAVLCASTVDVRSSSTISTEFLSDKSVAKTVAVGIGSEPNERPAAIASLDRDLEVELWRALATSLRAVPVR